MESHTNQDVPKKDLNPVNFLKNRESGKMGRTAVIRPKGIYIPSERIWKETRITDFSPYARFSWKSRIDEEGTKIYKGAIITDNHTTIHTHDEPVVMIVPETPLEKESSPSEEGSSSTDWDVDSWDSTAHNWEE